MYGTLFYYHTIICSTVNIIATTFALLFNLGPLSVLRANNRKNLMPTIPDLSESTFNYIMSITSFEKSTGIADPIIVRPSHHPHPFHSLPIEDWTKSLQLADAETVQVISPTLCRFISLSQQQLSTIAQHKEGDNLVARMMIVVRVPLFV